MHPIDQQGPISGMMPPPSSGPMPMGQSPTIPTEMAGGLSNAINHLQYDTAPPAMPMSGGPGPNMNEFNSGPLGGSNHFQGGPTLPPQTSMANPTTSPGGADQPNNAQGNSTAMNSPEIKSLAEKGESLDPAQLLSVFNYSGPEAGVAREKLAESLNESSVLRGAVATFLERNGPNAKVDVLAGVMSGGGGGYASLGQVTIDPGLGEMLETVQNHEMGHALLGIQDGPRGGVGDNQLFDTAVNTQASPDMLANRPKTPDGIVRYGMG